MEYIYRFLNILFENYNNKIKMKKKCNELVKNESNKHKNEKKSSKILQKR